MSALLALCAAPPDDERVEEYLRYLVGWVAAGRDVTWLVAGPGEALLDPEAPLSTEAETYAEALREAGIRPRAASGREVVEALAAHAGLMSLAPRERAGDPDLLIVDAARLVRAAEDPDALVREMLAAGQVVRRP